MKAKDVRIAERLRARGWVVFSPAQLQSWTLGRGPVQADWVLGKTLDGVRADLNARLREGRDAAAENERLDRVSDDIEAGADPMDVLEAHCCTGACPCPCPRADVLPGLGQR